MDDSILNVIKKMLGNISEFDSSFDEDIVVFINAAFADLCSIGVGPSEGFSITGNSETWSDFSVRKDIDSFIKTYIYFSVKIAFDPPASGTLMESYKNLLKKTEVKLKILSEKEDSSDE